MSSSSGSRGTVNKSERKEDFVLAGTVNGYIRCWQLSGSSGAKFLWSIKALNGLESAVVGIILLRDGVILSSTEDGYFSSWDLNNSKAVAFSSTGNEPLELFSVNLGSRLLISKDRACSGIRKIMRLPDSSHEVLVGHHNGNLHKIDLNRRCIVAKCLDLNKRTNEAANSSLMSQDPNAAVTLSADNMNQLALADAACERSVNSADFCLPRLTNREILTSFCATQTTNMRYLRSSSEFFNEYASSTVSSSLQSSLIRPNLFSGYTESCLVKSVHICYTLPGFVMKATPGEVEIVVSRDLQQYLGNDAVTAGVISRSSHIRLEWGYDPCRTLFDGINRSVSASYPEDVSSLDYKVTSIRPYTITLEDPYRGPEVIDGHPRISIRTNLQARQFPHSDESKDQPASTSSLSTVHEMTMEQSITALCAHSSLPIVFAGLFNNQVTVMSLGGGHDESEATSAQQGVQTRQHLLYARESAPPVALSRSISTSTSTANTFSQPNAFSATHQSGNGYAPPVVVTSSQRSSETDVDDLAFFRSISACKPSFAPNKSELTIAKTQGLKRPLASISSSSRTSADNTQALSDRADSHHTSEAVSFKGKENNIQVPEHSASVKKAMNLFAIGGSTMNTIKSSGNGVFKPKQPLPMNSRNAFPSKSVKR